MYFVSSSSTLDFSVRHPLVLWPKAVSPPRLPHFTLCLAPAGHCTVSCHLPLAHGWTIVSTFGCCVTLLTINDGLIHRSAQKPTTAFSLFMLVPLGSSQVTHGGKQRWCLFMRSLLLRDPVGRRRQASLILRQEVALVLRIKSSFPLFISWVYFHINKTTYIYSFCLKSGISKRTDFRELFWFTISLHLILNNGKEKQSFPCQRILYSTICN